LTVDARAPTIACPGKPDAAPRDAYEYRLSLDASVALPKDTPAPTLIVSGKEVGKLGSPLTLTRPAAEWLTNAAVLLRIESTCGPIDLPAELSLTRDREERDRGGEGAISSDVKLAKPLQTARVYLDNVQGKQKVELVFGKLPRSIEPGQRWKGELVLGTCPEAKKVSIGGKELGVLSTAEGKATLVDAAGSSCYESAFVLYRTDPSKGAPPGASDAPTRHAGKRVHEIGVPDYFLENPPQSKQTKDELHVDRVLRHAPCGR
jgi:hypothetical protein